MQRTTRIAALLLTASLLLTATAAVAQSDATDRAIDKECHRIGHKLGSVSVRQCLRAQFRDSGGRSVTGQPILEKIIASRSQPARGRILLIGGTHGDEYSAVSIVFRWLKMFHRYHADQFEWHVVPLLNPDGLLLHRPSVRMNEHGVDLNRNMPTPDWQQRTRAYWKRHHFDPRRYPGTAPLSEPETRWLYNEMRTFKPHAIVSIHAPYGVLDFDGPPRGPRHVGRLHLHLIGTYPGSLGNSAGVQHQIPVITVELPYAGIMPSHRETRRMWRDLNRWLDTHVPKPETLEAHARFDAITEQLMPHPPIKTIGITP